jgi:TatD DNase family protein
MPEFIDSHAHLYQPKFSEDIDEVLLRCRMAGVNKIVLPNIDLESLDRMKVLTAAYPDVCYPTVGLHPCDVKADFMEVLTQLKRLAYHDATFPGSRIVAIGETGLDYYWDITYQEEQKLALKEQIHWSLDLGLPIILHTRNSVQDTIDLIADLHTGHLTGVFHCFSGTLEEARQIIGLEGFYLGIGGTITYKNSPLPELLKEIPLERIMLETDAPYLSPVPYRGKRNESCYIPVIAEQLAAIKKMPVGEIADITTANAKALFKFD